MNLNKFRESFDAGELFAQAAVNRYWYDDQDVLNLRCGHRVKYLDMRWNLLYDSLRYRKNLIIGLAPANVRQQYADARKDPWIIHYAGGERPWNDAKCDFAEVFWAVADQTPAAERLREALVVATGEKQNKNSWFRRMVRFFRFICRKAYVIRQGRVADV